MSDRTDTKWRFYYRLRRFFSGCYVADARMSAQYENGWNDAVVSLTASLKPLYEGKEPPLLKTLLDDTLRPIPRHTVAEALAALRKIVTSGIAYSYDNQISRSIYVDLAEEIDATIAKLGLGAAKEKE